MAFFLFFSGIAYGAFSLSVSTFGVVEKELIALYEDLRTEVRLGGVKGLACRVIQPVIWLLALPLENLMIALALAGLLICAGIVL